MMIITKTRIKIIKTVILTKMNLPKTITTHPLSPPPPPQPLHLLHPKVQKPGNHGWMCFHQMRGRRVGVGRGREVGVGRGRGVGVGRGRGVGVGKGRGVGVGRGRG